MVVNKFDLIKGFSGVVDLVNTTLADHHLRVAYIAGELALRLGLTSEERASLVMASMLHDIGVIPLQDSTDDLVFERDMNRHALAGHLLLATCPLTRKEAALVRYHHLSWAEAVNLSEKERGEALLGNLIHLADMIDVNLRVGLSVENMLKALKIDVGGVFSGRAVEAAADFLNGGHVGGLTEAAHALVCVEGVDLNLSREEVAVFSMLFSHIIDARSPFTATHSSGVAHLALHLYGLAGLPDENRPVIFTAGLLHDIGKMGVPLNLLEKPDRLTDAEFSLVSRHADLSFQVLASISGFEKVAPWGAWHHEKLDGRGYPNGLAGADIPLEARLTAVADIMTALTEDRPYRPGMPLRNALEILDRMASSGALDEQVVGLVHDNLEAINETRQRAQTLACHFFAGLNRDIRKAVSTLNQGPASSHSSSRDPDLSFGRQ